MNRVVGGLAWLAQPLLVGALIWAAIGDNPRDLETPLVFRGEALFQLAQSKATLDHGWWWTNPSLGAPGVHRAVLFPASGTVDQLLVRVIGLWRDDVAPAATLAWLLSTMLGAVTAGWCLRRLGVSPRGAWTAGVLFALSPYALYEHVVGTPHGPFLVPFAAAVALQLATDRELRWRWPDRRVLFAGLLLLGLNSREYAAFAVFFVAVGTIAGARRFGLASRLAAGAVPLGVLAIAVILLSVPMWWASNQYGAMSVEGLPAAGSERYGLKLRQLVSPVPNHWFPPFRAWTDREAEAGFPLDTQNVGSRLGLVTSIGFLGLLAVVLVPRLGGRDPQGQIIRGSSSLVLAALLLATVGGFGSVAAVLGATGVGPYARIAPFIAFLSLAALALAVDRALMERRRLHTIGWTAILVVGLLDQAVGLRPLNAHRSAIAEELRPIRVIVDQLEARLPSGAMIFQLPTRPYPVDGGAELMEPGDHFKPYLVSRALRWSFPASSRAQVRWQDAINAVSPRELPAQLLREGFSAVVVDRRGYADRGEALVAEMQAPPNHVAMINQTDRYTVLLLQPDR